MRGKRILKGFECDSIQSTLKKFVLFFKQGIFISKADKKSSKRVRI